MLCIAIGLPNMGVDTAGRIKRSSTDRTAPALVARVNDIRNPNLLVICFPMSLFGNPILLGYGRLRSVAVELLGFTGVCFAWGCLCWCRALAFAAVALGACGG